MAADATLTDKAGTCIALPRVFSILIATRPWRPRPHPRPRAPRPRPQTLRRETRATRNQDRSGRYAGLASCRRRSVGRPTERFAGLRCGDRFRGHDQLWPALCPLPPAADMRRAAQQLALDPLQASGSSRKIVARSYSPPESPL
jgi:hypothetical protein